jgi:hypothetical protein
VNRSPSPHIPFRDPFDELLAIQGPPALFTMDAEGELRLDPFRTRDGWSRIPPEATPSHSLCHCLFRDRATGFVQYVLVTSPALYDAHPRADVRRFAHQQEALDALRALGEPPVVTDPW